ncbi:ATP-binding cassette domain-containing protein [Microbispora sp. NEAU-D428]|uniref:ABC transporter ATP-binding protein n=1 Tax=Microbispora sitophila TaxID=2771537 RepID=UPI001866ABBE|nr:ATP-binding cassette domain-containing protein [Microbispora sitophila]MBE3015623.1 ATP-binding cassette domain-containing protein [Microbispora sitophila]
MDTGRTAEDVTPSARTPAGPSGPAAGPAAGGAFGGVEVEARGLGVRGGHGWVYRQVSLHAAPGTLTVVTGEAGSGRTSLLLTLAGRMKPIEGTLTVGGLATPRRIRQIAALGLFTEVNPFDDALSVREHLQERLRPHGFLWRRRHPDAARSALAHAGLDTDALPDGDRTLTRELTQDQAVRLGVALALLDQPGLLLVDDADTGIPAGRRHELWDILRGLADQGLTVVAACTDAEEATGVATTLLPLPVPAPPPPPPVAGDDLGAPRRDDAEGVSPPVADDDTGAAHGDDIRDTIRDNAEEGERR